MIDNALKMQGVVGNSKQARRARMEMTDSELVTFLRDIPAADLVKTHMFGRINPPFSPVIEDGLVIPGHLHQVVESGRFKRVPTIIGATEADAGLYADFLSSQYEGMPDYHDLAKVVERRKTFDEVLPTPKDRQYWRKARCYCSLFCRAMSNEHARRLAATQNNIYVYHFCWGGEKTCSEEHAITYGSSHLIDLPFFFGNVDKREQWVNSSPMFRSFTDDNRAGRLELSEAMVSYLAQFMRTGNPNNALSELPEWEPWSNHVGGPKVLQLDANLEHAEIGMGTGELSIAGIRRALDNEPVDLRRHVLKLASVVQPFIPYEPGDFEFAVER